MKSATIGIRELRDGLSRHLTAVREGGEITVTDHGKPIARIIPVAGGRLEQLLADGRVLAPAVVDQTLPVRRRPKGPVSDLVER